MSQVALYLLFEKKFKRQGRKKEKKERIKKFNENKNKFKFR